MDIMDKKARYNPNCGMCQGKGFYIVGNTTGTQSTTHNCDCHVFYGIKESITEVSNEVQPVIDPVRLSMEEILRDAVRRQATYQVQFEDYDLDTWTAPVKLTQNRMDKLLDDDSIRKVRLELEM